MYLKPRLGENKYSIAHLTGDIYVQITCKQIAPIWSGYEVVSEQKKATVANLDTSRPNWFLFCREPIPPNIRELYRMYWLHSYCIVKDC